jgi:hypothetical protein
MNGVEQVWNAPDSVLSGEQVERGFGAQICTAMD